VCVSCVCCVHVVSVCVSCVCMCLNSLIAAVLTNINIGTNLHTLAHVHIASFTHSRARAHNMHLDIHTHARTHTPAHTQTHTHTHVRHTLTRVLKNIDTRTHRHRHTHLDTPNVGHVLACQNFSKSQCPGTFTAYSQNMEYFREFVPSLTHSSADSTTGCKYRPRGRSWCVCVCVCVCCVNQ
jgi:hypothetical protein